MINGKKIVVVMPAYNAAKTLDRTLRDLPSVVDEIVLVDDCSTDDTVTIASALGIRHVIRHPQNRGYGGNQKTCYRTALDLGADVVVMVHPDYQYEPRLVTAMSSMIAEGVYDAVLGSRVIGPGVLKGGMPFYKYVANRLLTAFQNIVVPYKLSEYHSGYRAFSRQVLTTLPLEHNSEDFVFDNQMLLQIIGSGFSIGEVSCPTRYMEDSSSINFRRSVRYGLAVVATTVEYKLSRMRLRDSKRFPA